MGKTKRTSRDNKGINITAIVILIIILITSIFLIIFILFSKAENNKKIASINNEIESLQLDSLTLNEKKDEIINLIDSVSDPTEYTNNIKDNYSLNLPEIENKIKNFDTKEKIAYLTLIVDKNENLDKVITTLNENNIISTFFINNKEDADRINKDGHLIGLYFDDEKKAENFKEEYKDIINTYHPNLFMTSQELIEKEITVDTFYKVIENSTSEGKKLLNQEAYINDIVETTADRDFLIIRVNLSNSVGINAIDGIISKLKEKNYIFLPLVSSSSLIEK